MKLKTARTILRYLPPGVQKQIEREARSVGVIIEHRHGRKTLETHAIEDKCGECEKLQEQGRLNQ